MDVFDIIGPIMIGPSSSHTAGACRIGKYARSILDEDVQTAEIYFSGSFAKTYRGHGTDKAIVAGLMGMDTDDLRIRSSLELAKEAGMDYVFIPTQIDDAHPNTVLLKITGVSGNIGKWKGRPLVAAESVSAVSMAHLWIFPGMQPHCWCTIWIHRV